MAAGKRIALVTCSTRRTGLNPFITRYVGEQIAPLLRDADAAVDTIDLADQALPLFDEPAIPSQLPEADPTPHYAHAHTRRWSALVRRYDAFVFVTPQYNWSVPAGLKNALDYLFYEWKGKPAGIVSYGGHGGGKSAAHLRDILGGLRMKPVAAAPALTTMLTMIASSTELGAVSEDDKQRWRDAGVEQQLQDLVRELLEHL